ncbi:hypothetical protein [Bradyrhizobium sp. USDA 4350]
MITERLSKMMLDAQRAGFQVIENAERDAWLVVVPARPRRPSQTLGDYPTSERAWMGACNIHQSLTG